MSPSLEHVILPRPGQDHGNQRQPISGPSETVFTETFGKLLPPAKYLHTAIGKAAYYELLPTSLNNESKGPDRVLLIHGIQTPALGMLPLARALQNIFPQTYFVLFDLWGHGLSDTPIAPHDTTLFHQSLDDLLNQLSWPSAHLIGFSFGGSTAATYLASRTSRVQSCALIAPVGLFRLSDFSPEDQAQLCGDDDAAARKWVFNFFEGGDEVVPADWKQRVEKGEVVAEAVRDWQKRNHAGHEASVAAMFRDGGAMDKHADFIRAGKTGVPSFAILGELDDVASEEQLKEHGFGNTEVVRQAGHGLVRESVPEVAALIEGFWKGL
ncbi:alpha/beta-hydrolase [Lophiostoma macrostomum CBS 122681]|uniref:Alpha/beta-hydrolase n=1 Tax=Lophiostoma macrostomum CBS 122681 TaxID=1314788 RepID=A0A6A6T3V6_9PLEO|nr:alpha/beta-hydrolase [Lophiostoma macrostomum CBS 122681]